MKTTLPDFFVIGTMKSGTTWLMECLNYHPEVTCFNELMILTLFRDGIGKILNNLNKQIIDGATTTFGEFNYPTPEFLHNDVSELTSMIWELLINKDKKNSKIFGEKSPDYINIIEDIVQWYPNSKYVHIVRNPKDVAISYYYHYKRESKFYDDGKILQIKDLSQPSKRERSKDSLIFDAITLWKSNQSTIETMKQRFPDKFLTIKYENMKNPKTLNSVYSFLGVKTNIDLCNCILEATDITQRSKMKNSFFTFGKSNNWQAELCEETIIYIDSLLGSWGEYYNYE